jgi:hypothetical protein
MDDREPVAWAVAWTRPIDPNWIYETQGEAAELAAASGGNVIPLYIQPHPTLTDAEREAVRWAIVAADLEKTETAGKFSAFVAERAATLRAMLERMK